MYTLFCYTLYNIRTEKERQTNTTCPKYALILRAMCKECINICESRQFYFEWSNKMAMDRWKHW
jgi:hypothetical protein